MTIGYEVDFLAVGDGEKSGDAIAIRIGDLYGKGDQFVMVIDGGTQQSGANLVTHIQDYYETNTVDLVVSTHPDADHCSGLSVVLEQLKVGRLWMHQPWEHVEDIRDAFKDCRITDDGLIAKLRRSLDNARDLERLAKRKGIPIFEPFSDGEANGQFNGICVLGPSTAYYEELLLDYRCTPEPKEAYALGGGTIGVLVEAARKTISKVLESFGYETLTDPAEDATSAENNSSVILMLQVDDQQLLFTGDAGVPALTRAADFAGQFGMNLQVSTFQQVPHHGSKRNVGPTILNRIVGPRLSAPASAKTVFVSASKDGAPKHPAKKVTNAYQRRGAKVLATQGVSLRHSHNAPPRAGWGPATPLPFYPEVEE